MESPFTPKTVCEVEVLGPVILDRDCVGRDSFIQPHSVLACEPLRRGKGRVRIQYLLNPDFSLNGSESLPLWRRMPLPCCLPSFSWLLFLCSGSALQTPPVTLESSQLGFALCPKKRHCLLVKKWQIWSQRTVSLHLSNNVGWHRYPGSVQGPRSGQPRLLGLSQQPKSPQTVHQLLASTQGLADDSSGCHWLSNL